MNTATGKRRVNGHSLSPFSASTQWGDVATAPPTLHGIRRKPLPAGGEGHTLLWPGTTGKKQERTFSVDAQGRLSRCYIRSAPHPSTREKASSFQLKRKGMLSCSPYDSWEN